MSVLDQICEFWYNVNMKMQRLLSSIRRGITEHNMIADGDKIAVGLSGGKDSAVLLEALSAYQIFSPEKFELIAVTIDIGCGADYSPMQKLCDRLGVEYVKLDTNIYEIIFEERKEKSPCSLCSKMRRGALNSVLNEKGCNKLALGHHADDVAETMLLSLMFEGRMSTFKPVSYMSRANMSLIRPLIYVNEKDIEAYTRDADFTIVHNPCPANHKTNREYMKELIKKLNTDIPFAGDNIKRAIFNPDRNNLWNDTDKENKE